MKTSAHNTMQHWKGEGGKGVSTTCVMVVYDLKVTYVFENNNEIVRYF